MLEGAMKTKVQRWGNSLAVRIPKTFAEEVGLTDNSPIEMRLVEGGLLLERSSLRPLTLDELLDGITESNRHNEVDTGPAQGLEAW
jgi:antitoxin MazE